MSGRYLDNYEFVARPHLKVRAPESPTPKEHRNNLNSRPEDEHAWERTVKQRALPSSPPSPVQWMNPQTSYQVFKNGELLVDYTFSDIRARAAI